MKTVVAALTICAVLTAAYTPEAEAKGKWVKYEAPAKYGFSMLVPKGTRFKERSWFEWGGVHANYWGVLLWGIARLGKYHTVKEIERFGVKVTGIPKAKWTQIHSGKKTNGFKWFKSVHATKGKHLFVAVYGVGPKGSYLLVLRTTLKSWARDKPKYIKWYKSINVK